MFDPKVTKYPYPEYTDRHYLKIKKNRGYIFDKNYPYIDNSKSFRFKRWWVRFVIVFIVFFLTRVRMGLRIKGRKVNKDDYNDIINVLKEYTIL